MQDDVESFSSMYEEALIAWIACFYMILCIFTYSTIHFLYCPIFEGFRTTRALKANIFKKIYESILLFRLKFMFILGVNI